MNTYWGSGGILHAFLSWALGRGEWPASRPGLFTTGERDPGTRWIGSWIGHRAGLDAVVKINIPTELLKFKTQQKATVHIYAPFHSIPNM